MDEPREQVIPRMQIIPSPGNREQQAVAVTSWDDPHESAPAPCPNALKTYKKKTPTPKTSQGIPVAATASLGIYPRASPPSQGGIPGSAFIVDSLG